jgi:hypothetical protein
MIIVFQISIAIFGAVLGLFLLLRPAKAIDAQRRFYERINWRIEPVSMEKEIRNTRAMGLFLMAAVLISILLGICSCAHADESGGLVSSAENVLSGDENGGGSGDGSVEPAGSSEATAVYERDAMGDKVPVSTDNSGDTNPIDQPL